MKGRRVLRDPLTSSASRLIDLALENLDREGGGRFRLLFFVVFQGESMGGTDFAKQMME